MTSPQDFVRQSRAGRSLVQRKFSLEAYPQRMRDLYEDLNLPMPRILSADAAGGSRCKLDVQEPAASVPRKSNRIGAGRKRVLFVATNGIGLGHITRLMAIAERMSPDVEPVFTTLSVGSSIIHARGHPVDYIASAPKIGVTNESWNRAYSQELL